MCNFPGISAFEQLVEEAISLRNLEGGPHSN